VLLQRLQVLGRNLEGVVNRASEAKSKWGDTYVSVEHLVLALAEDPRFGAALFRAEGITLDKLEQVGALSGFCWFCFFHHLYPSSSGRPVGCMNWLFKQHLNTRKQQTSMAAHHTKWDRTTPAYTPPQHHMLPLPTGHHSCSG
jgi:hypothetical protein